MESVTTASYGWAGGDWVTANGQKTESQTGSAWTATQMVAYGITDRLSFSASADWSAEREKLTFNDGTQLNGSQFQWSNPTFSVRFRAIDQDQLPVSLDTYLRYTAPIRDDRPEWITGGIAINRTMKSATLQFTANAEHRSAYDTTSLFIPNTPLSYSSAWTYETAVNGQLRMTPLFALNAGLNVLWYGDRSVAYANGTRDDDSIDPNVGIHASLVTSLIPDRLAVEVEYGHGFGGDDHRSNAHNGTWANQNGDELSLRVTVLY